MINLLSQITANYFLAKPRATGIYVKMEVREHIFVPLGNGTLFLGVVFGLEHLLASGVIEKMPKVIAIQSEHSVERLFRILLQLIPEIRVRNRDHGLSALS